MSDKAACDGLPVENDAHDWVYDEAEPDIGIVGGWTCECCGLTKEDDVADFDPTDYV